MHAVSKSDPGRTIPNESSKKGGRPPTWLILLIPVLFLIPGGCAFSDALGHYLAPAEQETPVDPPVVVTSTPLPSPTSTPTEIPCQETAGKVTRITVQAEDPLAPITASVYTPPCYDAETGGYPVLYLLHGQNQTDEYWFDLGAAQVADDAINAGRAPFLIVSPYEEDSFAPVAESDFGSEVVEELIPYIESHYAVCSTRACHAIGGISHGGGWAVHIALVHIDLFSSVGAHSPGYFIGDTSRIVRLRQTLSPDQFPRFYVDRGEKDYLQPEIDALDRTLTNYGITHVYQVSPGSHAESYWRAHVADYLNWYMDGFDSLR